MFKPQRSHWYEHELLTLTNIVTEKVYVSVLQDLLLR